ncbi:hypothetical protein [Variovorax sp. DAIF25]|uniref:hypothetical protein n=1 Tax=Variovorax sp. DAIF25 TaxID=3080983 RepID=UPI003D6B48EF
MAAPLMESLRAVRAPRYWAVGLGVALLAVFLFYLALSSLVHESAGRAPRLPPSIMPEQAKAPAPAIDSAPAVQPVRASVVPSIARLDTTMASAEAATKKAAPAFIEVQKCVMPEGDAVYSDAPCPPDAQASTLRLPSHPNAAARL